MWFLKTAICEKLEILFGVIGVMVFIFGLPWLVGIVGAAMGVNQMESLIKSACFLIIAFAWYNIGYKYGTTKPQQICVIRIDAGEPLNPDNVTKSDCSFFIGDK